MKSLGFSSGKSYVVHELNDLQLHSLFPGNYAAIVVNHTTEGVWTEVCYQCDDRKFLLATNSLIGNEHHYSHEDNIKYYKRDTTSTCIEEYRKNTGQTGRKFDHLEFALFIVPKKTISPAYLEYLTDHEVIDRSNKEKLIDAFRKKANMQKIFEIINNAFSSDRRARYVGEVAHPLNAQLYHRSDKK